MFEIILAILKKLNFVEEEFQRGLNRGEIQRMVKFEDFEKNFFPRKFYIKNSNFIRITKLLYSNIYNNIVYTIKIHICTKAISKEG